VIDALQSLDRSFFLLLNGWNASVLNLPMTILSGQAIWIPFLCFIGWLAHRELDHKSFGIFFLFLLLAIIASDVTSSYLLKNIVQRLRPCRLDELKPLINNFGQKCGGRFGFVSSHAANSFCLLMFSYVSLGLRTWRFHILWLLALLVSYSRIYLGVHYPGDILGGIIVGCAWAVVLGKLFRLRSKST
jgi:undecaprenyl-diphosphatase